MDSQPQVALSGEHPSSAFFQRYPNVGLLRSEYIFRSARCMPGSEEGISCVREYMHSLFRSGAEHITYRLADFETRDIFVLTGDGALPIDDNPIIGDARGIRRFRGERSSIRAEVDAALALGSDMNVSIAVPFVVDTLDIELVSDIIGGSVVPMIETPAALFCISDIVALSCVDRVIVGLNDLTGLILGAQRGSNRFNYEHPYLKKALDLVSRACYRANVQFCVAGNASPQSMRSLCDEFSATPIVHYGDWHKHFSSDAPLTQVDRDTARYLRAESDQRLVTAGLLHVANEVAVAGM